MTTSTKLTTSSLAIAFATRMRYAEDFDTSGALKGRAGRAQSFGQLPRVYWDTAELADYVVYSYATPIAFHAQGVWHIPDVKYSVTTSKHQSKIRAAIDLI